MNKIIYLLKPKTKPSQQTKASRTQTTEKANHKQARETANRKQAAVIEYHIFIHFN